MEGKIIAEKECILSEYDIDRAITNFPHSYLQEVPIYSAVHVEGKKLYEYARNGEEVILPKREVEIYSLKRISDVIIKNNHTLFKGEIKVSKGTFIRSFVKDFAKSLNTIGTLNSLTRIRQGNFSINDSYTIDDIRNGNYKLVDIKKCLSDYPIYEVEEEYLETIKNGALIDKIYKEDKVVLKYKDTILAIYQTYEKDKNKMKPWKMF